MKKFRYNMESILHIKLKLEDQAKLAYSNTRFRLKTEEEKHEILKKRKSVYEDKLRTLRVSKLDINKIKCCEEAVETMKLSIKQQHIIVKNAVNRLEVARIRLDNSMVERKTQEKLKEKAKEEYLLEFDAEERKETDELNSYNFRNPSINEEEA